MLFLLALLPVVSMVNADVTPPIYPTDDSTVADGSWADHVFNTGPDWYILHCRADDAPQLARGYLQFDLTGVDPDMICGATLYLYCNAATIPPDEMANDVCETDDGWDENSITWNNAPPVGNVLATTMVDGTGLYYAWSSDALKAYVKEAALTDNIVSFVAKLTVEDITKPSIYHRDFDSKEGDNDPYLVIQLIPQCVPEFGVATVAITSLGTTLMLTLKRLRK